MHEQQLVSGLTGLFKEKLDQYISEELKMKLSTHLNGNEVVEKLLKFLKPFLIEEIKALLRRRKILSGEKIFSMLRQRLPAAADIIIEIAFSRATQRNRQNAREPIVTPDAFEETTKILLEDILMVIEKTFMSSSDDSKPSKEQVLKVLKNQFSDRLLCLSERELNNIVENLIEIISLSKLPLVESIFDTSTMEDISSIFQRHLKKISNRTVAKACMCIKKRLQEGILPTDDAEIEEFFIGLLMDCKKQKAVG